MGLTLASWPQQDADHQQGDAQRGQEPWDAFCRFLHVAPPSELETSL